jgi:ubiquitin carboxyl-terminal hydrolase 8
MPRYDGPVVDTKFSFPMASYTNATTLPNRPRGSWADPRTYAKQDRPKGYQHLKDITVTAVPDVEPDTPLNLQLEKAEAYISSSRRALDFDRLDLAYKDHLKGFELAVNSIPDHREYGFYCDTRKGWKTRHRTLCRTIQAMAGKIEDVQHIIQDDNARSGVQPQFGDQRHVSLSHRLQMPSPPRNTPGQPLAVPTASQSPNPKPAVRPKPADLSDRFAALRSPSAENGEFRTRPQSYSPQSVSSNGSFRPLGPRDMPVVAKPEIPPKVPITPPTSMPRPPSPTYSPTTTRAASMYSNSSRSSNDPHQANGEKRATYYNQPNPVPQSLQRARGEDSPYRPRTPNGVHSAIIAKSSSSEIPHERTISVERLYEYRRKYNVLVIDVRDRETYDQGHIFTQSIMCIEPVSLKEGVSAEELEDRLVVSPESEQALFEKRNEFDIVVYMDQSTSSTNFLSGPPTGSTTPALRALYDTLYEFNDYKPLKDGRPPALLLGGLDAWVDFLGPQSLTASQTAALMGSTKLRRGAAGHPRPGSRRVGSVNSRIEVRRRRLQKYQPLNADEEQAWRQKAQAEEVDTTEYAREGSGEENELETVSEELDSPFVHDYESFLRKFPEVSGMQQSMTIPTRLPLQPSPPTTRFEKPVSTPAIPSRPPPAVPRPSYSGQADIQTSQAPLARQTSATRPPLYASYSALRRTKLPRTGLTNFGVTCYMNSTLQCLSATIPLSSFFLEDDRYKQYRQKNWKGSSGIMPELYTNLIRSLWKQDVEVIKPTTFRNFCGRMNREWVIDRQQDAKEFFDFLVDCLHEDLNVNWARTPLKPLTFAEEMQRERTPIAQASTYEWSRFQHRDFSYISSLFAGQHASRLRCITCHNTSTTYEAFYSISVEIPKAGQGNLQDCLRSYCQEERLSGDEVWKCPHCKCEREATKQIILTRLPQFLVIHFKRFSASKTESARKIHTPIDFPLYNLNMDHYVISRPLPTSNGTTTTTNNTNGYNAPTNKTLSTDPATTPPFTYDAYGVLRHIGSSGNGGHYVSLVKDSGRGCWRKYDDERTVDFEPARLRDKEGRGGGMTNAEAYIVFYQRSSAR